MPIKLVAFDMDGTLLNEDMSLSSRNKIALQNLKKAGITPCLSSGRPPRGLYKFCDELGFDLPLITFNGAEVLPSPKAAPIYANELNCSLAKEAFMLGVKNGAEVVMWQSDELIMSGDTELLREYQRMSNAPFLFYNDDIQLDKLSLRKVLWKYPDAERMAMWRDEMGEYFKDRLNVATSSPHLLEFVGNSVSKGVALGKLCDYLGIDLTETVVFGDGYNDLPMLQVAGLSVAMGNAEDAVKSHCDRVTLKNTEDGVAHFIENFILN